MKTRRLRWRRFAFAMVAPFGAALIQMAISRSREYIADEYAGKISGDPRALASALRKISGAGDLRLRRTGPGYRQSVHRESTP